MDPSWDDEERRWKFSRAMMKWTTPSVRDRGPFETEHGEESYFGAPIGWEFSAASRPMWGCCGSVFHRDDFLLRPMCVFNEGWTKSFPCRREKQDWDRLMEQPCGLFDCCIRLLHRLVKRWKFVIIKVYMIEGIPSKLYRKQMEVIIAITNVRVFSVFKKIFILWRIHLFRLLRAN